MRVHFWSALVGGLVAALVVSALPAVAAQVGDAFALGEINAVNAKSSLRGNVASTNLQIRNTGDGVPLTLKTGGSGVPPLVVDSRGKVRRLNADLLDSRHANGLIRAAFGSTANAPDADGDAVTATITAPQRGVLIMGGSIDGFGSTADAYSCVLDVDGSSVPGSQRIANVEDQGGEHTSNGEEDCSTDGGLVVDKGTHTVALDITGRDSVLFFNASVWVIWSPFDGQGRVPSLTDNPAAEPDTGESR